MNDEMTPEESTVEMLPRGNGRRVAVHRLADGDTGRTVVPCHPVPGSAIFDPDPEQTYARGVTLLAVDRPGYGLSDAMPSDGHEAYICWSGQREALHDDRPT
jgi:pimeloyl-ACP methyl ester carboxylesterase